jgi:DNA helicase-2/ATP-dependent DNA helicase PcrA
MPTTLEFETLYKKLNKEQKKAVDTIDGPVMVIAGPGTGKTQILTLRIANILQKTDVGADSILALTFTESATHTMRRRLAEIIGSPAYKVNIFTFHGFCNEIIRTYPEEFPRIVGAVNITDIDQIRIIEEVILSLKLEKLKPYGDPLYYLRPVLSQIKDLKREDIAPNELEKIIVKQEEDFNGITDLYYDKGAYKGKMKGKYKDLEKQIEKNKDLLIIYEAYEAALTKTRVYDYEDMIMEVVRVLRKNEDLRLRLQEKYQYILADEHQDANQAQNHILELLSSYFDTPNLFIVGDEKQAIFRFQGASLENFLYFKKLYQSATLIRLERNYRSTQSILDAAHSVISKNKIEEENLRVRLKSQGLLTEEKIKLYRFSEISCELLFLVDDIEEKIKTGVKPYEIAILFRDNKDVLPIVKTLEKTAIPFVVESGQDVLADDDINKLVAILKAINNMDDDEALAQALFVDFLEFKTVDIYRILRFAHKEKIKISEIISDIKQLAAAKIEEPQKFIAFSQKLSEGCKLAKNKNIVDFFETIVRQSGFLDHVLSLQGSYDKLNKLEVFFGEIKRAAENHKDYKLKELMHYLDTLAEHNILIKSEKNSTISQGVRLMTAHRSKGLEFDYVYIVGVYEGHWGNRRNVEHFKIPLGKAKSVEYEAIDDERRLFYVTLTRARKGLSISYSKEGIDKREQLPAQFIEEIDSKLIEEIDTKKIEEKLSDKKKVFSFAPQLNFGIDVTDKKYLRTIFLEQGFSVTALNKYLKCPWDYFFETLVRIPQPETKHQLYGQAIHETLKIFFDKYKNNEDLSKKQFLDLFEGFLRRKPFSSSDYEESRTKGLEALEGYFKAYKGSWLRSLFTEFGIAGVSLPITDDEGKKHKLELRGVLDKLELENGSEVTVVDYKTRQPITRNEIEGKTKHGTGDYKRQLTFYKILLDNYEQGKYKMRQGVIDFIEPDQNGTFKREAFDITAAEVKELEQLIQKVAHEILTFTFWNTNCDDKECNSCRLRKLINRI